MRTKIQGRGLFFIPIFGVHLPQLWPSQGSASTSGLDDGEALMVAQQAAKYYIRYRYEQGQMYSSLIITAQRLLPTLARAAAPSQAAAQLCAPSATSYARDGLCTVMLQ